VDWEEYETAKLIAAIKMPVVRERRWVGSHTYSDVITDGITCANRKVLDENLEDDDFDGNYRRLAKDWLSSFC
jgi:hypothetical protein